MPVNLGFDHKISRPVVRMIRRMRTSRKRLVKHSRRCCFIDGSRKRSRAAAAKAVAERLEALRSLIPPKDDGGSEKDAAADRLFEETADYILLLRTQVEVLKRLVDIYSPCLENNGASADCDET